MNMWKEVCRSLVVRTSYLVERTCFPFLARNLLLMVLLLSTFQLYNFSTLSAQTSHPPFLQMDYNLIYRNSDRALGHFFTELDALVKKGDRQVSILHLGDSHVQSGFFSNELRKQLQKTPFFGNGGRGLVFPYKVANTNGPLHYGVEYTGEWDHGKCTSNRSGLRFGVTGYTIASKDTAASITLWTSTKHGNPPYEFDEVTVLHSTGAIQPVIKNWPVDRVSRGKGHTTYHLPATVDSFRLDFVAAPLHEGRTEVFGILLNSSDPGLVYHSAGVNGATLEDFLNCQQLVSQVTRLAPDLVIISLGTNDAYYSSFDQGKFHQHYERLLDSLAKAAPEGSVILTTPGDGFRYRRYFNYNYLRAREVIMALAEERDLAVWDFFSVMGGPNAVYQWYREGYAQRDKLHLTQSGYRLQGELLYKALLEAYYAYLEKY